MSLPAISTAAYVYSTNQSAVQVTYADASTTIVYPNQFESPRTQQLNDWVRGGGQIAPYVKPPVPVPGPPQFISCYIETEATVAYNQDITTWGSANALGLSLNAGTTVQLQAGRAYQIDLTVGVRNILNAPNFIQFTLVNAATNVGLLPGENINNLNIRAIASGNNPPIADGQNDVSTLSYIYTPTENTLIKVRLTGTGGGNTNTCTVRQLYSSWTIAEIADESLYAAKVGPRGPAGPAGPVGPTGPVGPLGPAGPVGGVGPVGPEGPVGPQGQPGPGFSFLGDVPAEANLPTTGVVQDDAYVTTDTGDLWIYDGTVWNNAGVIQGSQGVQGTQGPAGATGPAGPQGPAGPAGPTGATGAQGPVGAIGPAGPTGATGATGSTGPVGPQGPQGVQGVQGPIGPAGAASVIADSWSGELGQFGPTPATLATVTIPTGATAYAFTANLQWLGSTTNGYGAFQTMVTVTNSTTGYSEVWTGSDASWRVISNMAYPTNGVVMGGASGLVGAGQYVLQFQATGQFQDSPTAGGQYQYVVTYW